MKPFSFFPTASGAAKIQPMSASDITRINRIRASSAAYPNILSNPPKNISNLSLNTSEISSIRFGNTINGGIFSYGRKIQPVVETIVNDSSNNQNNQVVPGKGGNNNLGDNKNPPVSNDNAPSNNDPPAPTPEPQPQPNYGQPVDSAIISNDNLRIVFTYSKTITDININIYPDVGYSSDFTINELTILDTNIYLYQISLSSIGQTINIGTNVDLYFYNNDDYKNLTIY